MKTADLLTRLAEIEKQSADSPLVIYKPALEHEPFYYLLCTSYLTFGEGERIVIREAINGRPGVINNLLGYIYTCVQKLQETRNPDWFMTGLAAASIRGDGPDFRDFYLAMAELYAVALETGLQPKTAFNAMGGGVPADFDTFAVVKSRMANNPGHRNE